MDLRYSRSVHSYCSSMTDLDDNKSPILEETKKQLDIVPYTKRDRLITISILVIVLANFLLLAFSLPWGSVL